MQCALKIGSVLRNGGTGKLSTAVHMVAIILNFFDQRSDAVATVFLAASFGGLLFEGAAHRLQ